ncbi:MULTISPECIES: sugar ABC transporter substrate-binding protein [Paraburkholderia]|jgi:simple sugar transport system substrate-binding protein|uniref:Monosaccharide ABC transporter substrate-binding protein, CUT2 family n=1 Tax=Paraburkholderia phenazinium TaxID=60549 RepID=A0A1N6KXT0_9BURK|nr:sugar ABC transporter substrate-binding protein [Paraburkholderia phenazinium]SIO61216.1 monosaccharide ABC transporter substrate-binding protein, CUT2 family [Paraburkholderia phenazinium]
MRLCNGKATLRILVAALALTAGLAATTAARAADAHFVLISHAPDSDSWWNTIKNAIKQADEDFNVETDYRNPPNGDIADMARLIEQAAARNYDGVIVTIADYDVLKGSIGKVTEKHIPLVTINSGTEQQSADLGAIMHIGQPEYTAGKAAGEKAKAAGVKSFLCVNHYATNPASFERCRGFADALGVDFKTSTLDAGTDPTGIQSKVSAYLRNHPDTGGVLALGPLSAAPTIKALQQMGLAGKLWFATFDFDDDIAKAIKDGTIKFAIDQQPYLQGYIAVAVLAIARHDHTTDPVKIREALQANPKFQARLSTYGLAPSYGPRNIGSGPGFITKENIDKVIKYAGQYR